jgi:hypothetical protein
VIAGVQDLPEDGLGFVEVVAENRSLSHNAALRLHDFDGSRVALWQRRNVRYQGGFIHGFTGFVGVDGVFGEVRFPGCPIAARDRVD